jgi:hypothetical protein
LSKGVAAKGLEPYPVQASSSRVKRNPTLPGGARPAELRRSTRGVALTTQDERVAVICTRWGHSSGDQYPSGGTRRRRKKTATVQRTRTLHSAVARRGRVVAFTCLELLAPTQRLGLAAQTLEPLFHCRHLRAERVELLVD